MINNKRAVSEIISYIMIILIALSVSVIVFGWLRFQIPDDQAECPSNVNIVIKDYDCDVINDRIMITTQNKGLFNIDGFFIRASIGSDGEIIHPLTPEKKIVGVSEGLVFFLEGVSSSVLEPGEEYSDYFYYFDLPHQVSNDKKIYDIEIQPIKILENNTQVVCEDAIIKQRVGCNVPDYP